MTTTLIPGLSAREIRNVITLLAAGRGVDFAAQAMQVPREKVRTIHQHYGPDRDRLLRSADQLLRQMDAEASTDSTPPTIKTRVPTPAPSNGGAPKPQAEKGSFQVGMVSVKNIAAHPSNLRRELGDLRDLASSIKQNGIRVPVVLEQHRGRYRLRDGHRRVAAAQIAGVTRVPAIVHAEALDERAWLLEAIDYNLRRQGYTDDDKRRIGRQLLELGLSRTGVAEAFGITTAKLGVLLDPKATPAAPAVDRTKRTPTSIGRRTVLTAVQDWRTRDVDAATILTELEQLLAPGATAGAAGG